MLRFVLSAATGVLIAALIVLVVTLGLIGTGRAEEPTNDTLSILIGEWAPECAVPPSDDNLHVFYRPGPEGTVLRRSEPETQTATIVAGHWNKLLDQNNAGGELSLLYEVQTARADTVIDLNTLIHIDLNRLRLWQMKLDGKKIIANGEFADGSGPTVWFERCTEKK